MGPSFLGFFVAPFLCSRLDLFFVLKGQHNYLVKSMSPFFSPLLHYEIAKVVTFFKDMIWVKNQRLMSSLHSQDITFCPKSLQLSPPGVTTDPSAQVQDSMFSLIPPHGSFITPPRLDKSGLEATTVKAMAKMKRAIFILLSLNPDVKSPC